MNGGRWLKLSPGRRIVCEILHHARKVPSLPLSYVVHLPKLQAAREQATVRPSWTSLFLKAYALVGRDFPEIRQAYLPYPWPHLYEHSDSVASVIVERDVAGENVVLVAKVRAPETQALDAVDGHLRRFRDAPVHEVSCFRQLLRWGRLPGVLRRFAFWHSLTWYGPKRAKRMGTFTLSSLGNLGITQEHPLAPLTTYLTFGPISPEGAVEVKLIYDHRVIDGRTVGRILHALEAMLEGAICEEVRAASVRRAA